LHPQAAAAAGTPPAKLVDWMISFQFDGVVDFFELDPVAYAPALGEAGVTAYRERLADVETRLGPRPAPEERWSSPHAGAWFVLDRTRSGSPSWIATSTPSSRRTHETAASPPGSRTRPRPAKRSASRTWRSTGRGRRCTS